MSKISEKLAAMRGGGHHVSPGLGEILEDFDKRLAALEPKKAEEKPEAHQGKSIFAPPGAKPAFVPSANPLDGTYLKS